MADWCAADGCSCGLQHAAGKGTHGMLLDGLGFNHIVHQYAAAEAVAIPLRRDTANTCRRGDREFQRPRHGYFLNIFRVAILVEIADLGHSPWRPENFVPYVLGVDGLVVGFGVAIRQSVHSAEDAVQARHGKSASDEHGHDDQRNPYPPQNPEYRGERSSTTLSRPSL